MVFRVAEYPSIVIVVHPFLNLKRTLAKLVNSFVVCFGSGYQSDEWNDMRQTYLSREIRRFSPFSTEGLPDGSTYSHQDTFEVLDINGHTRRAQYIARLNASAV